ncbi:MAG TPA: hypothetical protein VGQ57_20050, partial [Polyangiaceae bacterium]|nr:hypothetical protein [Polyangiaceae bacterium]
SRWVGGVLALGVVFGARSAAAAEETKERQITTTEIESWLEAEPGATPADKGVSPADEKPLLAPRRHGFVLESGIGFVTQIGALAHITPTAPDFDVRFGYEFLTWLMPFVEADIAFANTGYASPPPPPRSYFHFGTGAGVRFTLPVGRLFAVFAQGSAGLATVSEQNVLSVYGFPNADAWNLYLDGRLGFEWYQVNPHLALGVHGGIRSYGQGLTRDRGGDAPLALLASANLRYAF